MWDYSLGFFYTAIHSFATDLQGPGGRPGFGRGAGGFGGGAASSNLP